MSRRAIVYRILIASPTDVQDERKAIIEVIHSWNSANSLYYGVYLEPVLFETHISPDMGDRPQAIINKQLVKSCDILIGVFSTRLGTPTGQSLSGTVEEIEEFRKDKKPTLLYFSKIPVVLNDVDIKQYKELQEFIENCRNEGIVLNYKSINQLQQLVLRNISTTINSIHSKEQL